MKNKKETTGTNKHVNNLKLLFSMNEVQQYINSIRNILEIPPEMYGSTLSAKKNKLSEKWMNCVIKKGDEILANKNQASTVSNFPMNILDNSVKRIIKDFNLPHHYDRSISHYILFGTIQNAPGLPFIVQAKSTHERTVTLQFFEKLNDKDLITVKKFVNDYFGKELPQVRPIQNVDAKLLAESQYSNRKNYDPHFNKETILSYQQMANNIEEETGEIVEPKNIYEYSREIKELKDKRFGNK